MNNVTVAVVVRTYEDWHKWWEAKLIEEQKSGKLAWVEHTNSTSGMIDGTMYRCVLIGQSAFGHLYHDIKCYNLGKLTPAEDEWLQFLTLRIWKHE